MPAPWVAPRRCARAAAQPAGGRLRLGFGRPGGTDTSDSDIDVALVCDVNLCEVTLLVVPVELKVGRHVHVNLYDRDKWGEDQIIEDVRTGPRIPLLEMMDGQAEQPDNA